MMEPACDLKPQTLCGQRKVPIPDSLRMKMQAAVDLGLSENQTGKLFGVPSVTRALKDLRIKQQNERAKRAQMSAQ